MSDYKLYLLQIEFHFGLLCAHSTLDELGDMMFYGIAAAP